MTRLDTVPNTARAVRVVATLDLPLAEADWPRFRAALAEAAQAGGWTLRDFDSPRALGGHLRRPDGVQLSYKQWAWANPPEPSLTLYVVAPAGTENWREPVEALMARLQEP